MTDIEGHIFKRPKRIVSCAAVVAVCLAPGFIAEAAKWSGKGLSHSITERVVTLSLPDLISLA
jgi:hypothetical protein